MKKIMKLLLVVSLLVGCSSIQSNNLMDGIKKNDVQKVEITDEFIQQQMNFSLNILKKLNHQENICISPLSMMIALSMCANGADNHTLIELENVLGSDLDNINKYLYSYIDECSKNELKISNSIWIKDSFNVNKKFLQIIADYYSADVYKSKFDESTIKDMNHWVDDKTDHMIDKIIEKLNNNAIMVLLNAIAFDAKWEEKYERKQIINRPFTNINNEIVYVEMLSSSEHDYLENEYVKGFKKNYKNNQYSFVGLLPNENYSISEVIENLNYVELLNNIDKSEVNVMIPKFEVEYDVNLNSIFNELGIKDAFDENKADFSELGISENGNVYLSHANHKTYISLDENGTKASAITILVMEEKCAEIVEKEVILDRPFIYMIVDNNYNIPIFIGTITNLNNPS